MWSFINNIPNIKVPLNIYSKVVFFKQQGVEYFCIDRNHGFISSSNQSPRSRMPLGSTHLHSTGSCRAPCVHNIGVCLQALRYWSNLVPKHRGQLASIESKISSFFSLSNSRTVASHVVWGPVYWPSLSVQTKQEQTLISKCTVGVCTG